MVVIMQSVRIRGEFGMVCWHKAKVQLAQSRLADNLHSPSKEIFILVCRRSIVQTTHTCVIHGCLVCIHLILLCRKDTLWLAIFGEMHPSNMWIYFPLPCDSQPPKCWLTPLQVIGWARLFRPTTKRNPVFFVLVVGTQNDIKKCDSVMPAERFHVLF